MGVDYSAVLVVGTLLEDDSEVMDKLAAAGFVFTDEEQEIIDEDGIGELLYSRDPKFKGLSCQTQDCYSGYGRFLGFDIKLTPYETLASRIKEAQDKYKEIFGEDAKVINEVRIH